MIKLVVTNEKNLELYELEKVHVGENKFGYYLIFLPEMLNDYNLSECEVKLIQIFENNTSVAIDVDTTQEVRPIKEFITLDATAQAQTVTLSVLITHNGDVIGKTNQKTYQVYPTKNATPIDPREDLDEIIAELRAEIAEQAETISEQATAIEAKDGQISELNDEITEKDGQITELNTENTRLENLTDTQRETIQNMLDNPPQPKLYTPPEPIIPESETRVYTPPQDYDGFASFTVTGTSYMNIDLQKWVSPSPNDEPFEMIFETTVRSYIAYNQTKMIKATILTATSIESYAFYSCTGLQSVVFPASLISISSYAFSNCTSLTELTLPDSLTSISNYAFSNCTSLTELTLAQGFNCNGLNVSASTRFTAETIVACLEALADRTGQTAYTITFGSTNLKKLTPKQKAIATNKNWNLA